MEYSEIRDAIESFDKIQPAKLKRYIHYRSFRNFVTHFVEIRDDKTRELVLRLLSGYVDDVRAKKDHNFSASHVSAPIRQTV
jgi:predicted transport protein